MHLGMSGSFRVVHGSDESGPGNSITRAESFRRTIMWCFTCRTAQS